MLNFREELEKTCRQAAEQHHLDEVENIFETLLKMFKESSTIEILTAKEVVICISKKSSGLFHIHATCKTYEENKCVINRDIFDTTENLECLKSVFEFVLRSQKLQYDIEYKPIKYDNITPAEYSTYEIRVRI